MKYNARLGRNKVGVCEEKTNVLQFYSLKKITSMITAKQVNGDDTPY